MYHFRCISVKGSSQTDEDEKHVNTNTGFVLFRYKLHLNKWLKTNLYLIYQTMKTSTM